MLYIREKFLLRGLSIIAIEWKRPTKNKGKKKKRNAYSNKAQGCKLFLRQLHVIGTTIYGIKVQLRSFNISLFPRTQHKYVSYTEYSWHRYYPDIYWSITDEYLPFFPKHDLFNLEFWLEYNTFFINLMLRERSPLSMARALQGRRFCACSDSLVVLRVHAGTSSPIFQAKLSFFKPLQGKETTGSLCCWKLHSSRFSDHTPTPGCLPVEANKCFDWRQAGDCRDKKLLRSC